MKFKILTILSIIILCSLPMLANAAKYNWYFSDDAAGNAAGNDTTGDGSEAKPWKTLSKAQSQIDSVNSGDTVNLYFDRGDTWSYDSAQESLTADYGIAVGTTDPIVNVDAYGSGDRPIFDGLVTDFSAVPVHDPSPGDGPVSSNRFFSFWRPDCSVSNIEIKRVYGHGIVIKNDGGLRFTLAISYIHDFGTNALKTETDSPYTVEDNIVEYNTMHTGQELFRYAKISGWGPAIDFNDASDPVDDNIVRYNVVYDIYGEGINNMNGITEYNVIGDTGSVAINTSNHNNDALDTIVRYNLLVHQDWASSYCDAHPGGDHVGIRIFDERLGGDNSAGTYEIYGNTVINFRYGMRIYMNADEGNQYASVKVYNNLIIDSHTDNIRLTDPEDFAVGYIYNNVFILFDQTDSGHASDRDLPHANWTIENNAFWTTGGSPTVDTDWDTNYVITDPKLPGELSIDWDGQSGPTYYYNINLEKHIYPPSDSGLVVGSGKVLGPFGVGFNPANLPYFNNDPNFYKISHFFPPSGFRKKLTN